jgi:hypothetical protein
MKSWFLLRSALALALSVRAAALPAQAHDPHVVASPVGHEMYMRTLPNGLHIMGMLQLIPALTAGLSADANDAISGSELYLTQPALMFNLESPGSRVVLRTTLNFEGVTQEDGELTPGAWGEGFIDRRHPHTLLHEAMLSFNFWDVAGGALSLSAGKGFAPFGTDDPMARPVVKYPTNHHLSQILERWTVNASYLRSGWSIEAGTFGGTEPDGPYDFSNIESFPNSWSARVARRFEGSGTLAAWELSASWGHVVEEHDDAERGTRLLNAAVRHEHEHGWGGMYFLVEASHADPDFDANWWSLLGEGQLEIRGHHPYGRLELATRPEYQRGGAPGTDDAFRYDHDAEPTGATRWFIATGGYEYQASTYPLGALPFIELQFANAANHRGDVSARELFGTTRLWTLTAGARLYFGGGPMRMGSYGVLDAMTDAMRAHGSGVPAAPPAHEH